MNKNKGFIGIGLIIAIVLGIVIVGGGAYYLGKSGSKQEVNNPADYLPANQDQNSQQVVNDKPSNTTTQIKLTTYNSKTFGYSIGYSGIDIKNVSITGDGKDINLFPNQSNIDTLKIVDSSYVMPSYISSAGTVTFGTNQYKKFKDNITSRHTYYLISGLKNNKSIFISIEGDSDNPNYLDLSSLKIDTINSATTKPISTTLPQYIGIHSDCGEQLKCWPPVIATFSQSYSCNIGVAPNTEGNYVTAQRVINGRTYCINSLSSGYAGGRGYTYAYTTSNGNGTKIATFGLTYQSCGVWQGDGTSKYSDCQTEQSTFKANLDNIIDSLM